MPIADQHRRIVLGGRAALGLSAGGAILLLWAVAATWFVAARDDLAQRVFVREAELQYRYEDRIAGLQSELERAVTRNLVERDGVAARLDGVAKRQLDIENRQAWLARLADRLPAADGAPLSILERPTSPQQPAPPSAYMALTKPAPLPEPFALRLRDAPVVATPGKPPARDRLSLIEGALDTIALNDIRLVDGIRRNTQERLARLKTAINATGLNLDQVSLPKALGGPLVALPQTATPSLFGPLAAELEATFDEFDRTLTATRSIPIGRPLTGEMETTSTFGYRLDPFTRSAALHTGTDFRAEAGSPVRATAAGRVTTAEYSGGYGNMVEVDHGGGLVTRYGHLSAFSVSPGDRVDVGEMVGRVGSTGRSTGSHLHYETRINGEPVNPVRFLAAGSKIASAFAALR